MVPKSAKNCALFFEEMPVSHHFQCLAMPSDEFSMISFSTAFDTCAYRPLRQLSFAQNFSEK